MKLIVFFIICIISANAFYIEKDFNQHKRDRIVGGKRAFVEALPYQVRLLSNGIHICGATILSDRWILTAAHCIVSSSPKWTVVTGSSYLIVGGDEHEVISVTVHSEYDKNSGNNDIAMLKLTKPISFNERQRPITVSNRLPKAGDKATVSGFGIRGDNLPQSPYLEVVLVPIIDQQECQRRYKNDPITDNMFCAGNGTTDSCLGDSGGPAAIDGELVGIISSGMECASKLYPGVYVKLYNYRNWIADIMEAGKPSFWGSTIEQKKTFFQTNIVEPSKKVIEAVKSFIDKTKNKITTWAHGISETFTNFFKSVI